MRWSCKNTRINQLKDFHTTKITNIGISGACGLALIILGLFIIPTFVDYSPVHADSAPDPTTISITPISGINLNMTPAAGTNGSFGTVTANVTVNTTGAAGYIFTMNTQTTSTDLKSERVDYTDPTKADLKITNITASTTQANFSPNKWGYNVNKSGTYIKGAANTYVPVPNSGSSDADRQIDATDIAGSNTYTFTYGVKANNNLPAGEYANTLVFSATANYIPYRIIYNANTTDLVTDLPPIQYGNTYDDSIALSSTKPSRSGYGFFGWCTEPTNGATCPGTTYRAGNKYPLNKTGTNEVTLYAIWGTYAELDTGPNVCAKIKTVAAGGASTACNALTSDIKAIHEANALPSGFVPSSGNTISLSTSTYPAYIWYDNTNSAGILYVYTPADKIRMNTDSKNILRSNLALNDIPGIADWDSQNVTDLQAAFLDNLQLGDFTPLANWDTSSSTTLYGTFGFNKSTIDAGYNPVARSLSGLESWDTSNVTTMRSMFQQNRSLTNLSGLENWDTSSVADMSYMFNYCISLADISALSNWDTSNVTTMYAMFRDNHSLTNLSGLENWDTSSVADMTGMFINNTSLTDLSGIENWNTNNVTNMNFLFGMVPGESKSIDSLTPLANWNTSNVTDMGCLFQNVNIKSFEPLANWNVSNVRNFGWFNGWDRSSASPTGLTTLHGLEGWNVTNATDMSDMFEGIISLTDASAINNWNILNVTNFTKMFNDTPVHPTFTKRTGTWNSEGTFIPNS